MKIEISTTKLFQGIILFMLVYELPYPWWKWLLYMLSAVGITVRGEW